MTAVHETAYPRMRSALTETELQGLAAWAAALAAAEQRARFILDHVMSMEQAAGNAAKGAGDAADDGRGAAPGADGSPPSDEEADAAAGRL